MGKTAWEKNGNETCEYLWGKLCGKQRFLFLCMVHDAGGIRDPVEVLRLFPDFMCDVTNSRIVRLGTWYGQLDMMVSISVTGMFALGIAQGPSPPPCSLNGELQSGKCACDKPWSGPQCSIMNFKPVSCES